MRVVPLLLALALLSIPAAAVAVPAETQPTTPAAEGGCAAPFDLGAELGLREVAASPAAAAAEAGGPEWLRPAKRLGYCHCGCGARCQTSADCGGSPCRPFITCC